ncbi:MAG: nuclear transport factor 2 family protein, partial [Myxococcota bacterium]
MHPVDRFRESFANFDPATPFPVEQVYAPDVTFEDPAHRIDGREALAAYFARLDRNLKAARFTFHHDVRGDSVAALSWTMELHLRVGPRRPVVVPGTTWVEHDAHLVTSQRDHFDLGAMLYEQVPVLGTLV